MNKTLFLLLVFAILIPASLPGNGINIGIKIPETFYFSESNYLLAKENLINNKFSLSDSSSENYNSSLPVKIGAYTVESIGSVVGGTIGAVPGALFMFMAFMDAFCCSGYNLERDMSLFTLTYTTLIPLGASTGTILSGKIFHQKGTFGKAIRGAIIGEIIGFVGGMIIAPQDKVLWGTLATAPGAVIGSVVGYNF